MKIEQIVYSSLFLRKIKKYRHLIEEIREREALFRNDCFDTRLNTHKLHGLQKSLWSFSITRKHRILFEFVEKATVVFINIGDHSIYL